MLTFCPERSFSFLVSYLLALCCEIVSMGKVRLDPIINSQLTMVLIYRVLVFNLIFISSYCIHYVYYSVIVSLHGTQTKRNGTKQLNYYSR